MSNTQTFTKSDWRRVGYAVAIVGLTGFAMLRGMQYVSYSSSRPPGQPDMSSAFAVMEVAGHHSLGLSLDETYDYSTRQSTPLGGDRYALSEAIIGKYRVRSGHLTGSVRHDFGPHSFEGWTVETVMVEP